jgi:hypothetical protein
MVPSLNLLAAHHDSIKESQKQKGKKKDSQRADGDLGSLLILALTFDGRAIPEQKRTSEKRTS